MGQKRPHDYLREIDDEIAGILAPRPNRRFNGEPWPVASRPDDVFPKGRLPISILSGLDNMLPSVPPAPPFRAPTQMVGSPEFIDEANEYMRLAPHLTGWLTAIQQAPTKTVFDLTVGSDIPADRWNKTTLDGVYSSNDRDIWVHPEAQESTLLHEMGHAAGIHHGPAIENLEGLARMRKDAKRLYGDK